jgi:hypothetical protein
LEQLSQSVSQSIIVQLLALDQANFFFSLLLARYSTTMSSLSLGPRAPDTRNVEWVQSNVGARLLSKMGWKHGQAVGRRHLNQTTTITTEQGNDTNNSNSSDTTTSQETLLQQSETLHVSSEGLRVVKRQDGLGLGASHILQTSTSHTKDFAMLLQQLNQEHSTQNNTASNTQDLKTRSSKSRKRKASKKEIPLQLPTNKTTHHKIRQAKFKTKTQDDMKCIFAGAVDFPVIVSENVAMSQGDESKQEKKSMKKKSKNKSKTSKNVADSDE